MNYSSCGHWNRVSVNKIFIEQNIPEPKARASLKIMLKSLKIGWSEEPRF